MSEQESVFKACIEGDERAWRIIVQRYAGLVYSIARGHRLSEASCQDVAQEVFVSLWKSLRGIEQEGALAAWLSTTTRRACWRMMQRAEREEGILIEKGRESGGMGSDGKNPNSQNLERIEQGDRVRRGLIQLGGKCRELLELLFITQVRPDYEAIAAKVGIPVGSIGPTRQRCLGKLAQILEEEAGPE